MPDATIFDQGHWAGVVDTTLAAHDAQLKRINGSVALAAENLASLTREVAGIREDARLREQRALVATQTLADETERRRKQIVEEKDNARSTFSRRERILSGCFAASGLVVAVLSYLAITSPS